LNKVKTEAKANNLNLAISNPCIELWLLLHFDDPPGIDTVDGFINKLKQHIPGYDKSVDFSQYEIEYQRAVRGAKSLDDRAIEIGDPGRNPTTGMWRLTEEIRRT